MEHVKRARLIVGITGVTGTIFGVWILQMPHGSGVTLVLRSSLQWFARNQSRSLIVAIGQAFVGRD